MASFLSPSYAGIEMPSAKMLLSGFVAVGCGALVGWIARAMLDRPRNLTLRLVRDAQDLVRQAQHLAIGGVVPFLGSPRDLPGDLLQLDGRFLAKQDYPELHAIVARLRPDEEHGERFALPNYNGLIALSLVRFPTETFYNLILQQQLPPVDVSAISLETISWIVKAR